MGIATPVSIGDSVVASRKDILKVVGKTIAGVIVKEGGPHPASQCFLIFTDNSVCELYSDESEIIPSFTYDRGAFAADWVRPYMDDAMKIKIDLVDMSLMDKNPS